jgi:hypothetical protein
MFACEMSELCIRCGHRRIYRFVSAGDSIWTHVQLAPQEALAEYGLDLHFNVYRCALLITLE